MATKVETASEVTRNVHVKDGQIVRLHINGVVFRLSPEGMSVEEPEAVANPVPELTATVDTAPEIAVGSDSPAPEKKKRGRPRKTDKPAAERKKDTKEIFVHHNA